MKFKAKSIKRNENSHLILMKGKIYNKNIIDMNLCLLIKYQNTKQNSLDKEGRIDRNIIIVAYFNVLLSV